MCLILFAINSHPRYKFVLAANRDEFFNRPTLFAGRWEEDSRIIGGRDVSSNGTWLGITENSRFVAITNYRNPHREKDKAKSRGLLSKDFLLSTSKVKHFTNSISLERNLYNGFNILLTKDGFKSITHYSNISNEDKTITSGIHGLSNAFLDTSWPKVEFGKQNLHQILSSPTIDPLDLIKLLKNQSTAPDDLLPDTGISFDLEKKLSPVFISMNGYGTRCSTAILVDQNDQVRFLEVSYNENAEVINSTELVMQLKY
jgi:uncharacterized protein with NRDE domain